MTQRMLHAAQILWPAFLVAGVLEMIVFSSIDPELLRLGSWQPDTQTAYSVSFMMFWALIAAASAISHWLMAMQDKANGAQTPSSDRIRSSKRRK